MTFVTEEHRGEEIAAERDEGNLWRPVVDGDYLGLVGTRYDA
jgi:hypothetical protein